MQADFLEGRRSSDNVIITQKLIYSLKGKRGKDGCMVVKINLEKAYDHIEWSFIKWCLNTSAFPQKLLD